MWTLVVVMNMLLYHVLLFLTSRVVWAVVVDGREKMWSKMTSLSDQVEQSGQVWTLEGVSRLRCSVECTTDSDCESLFYNHQLTRCIALSKQPEDFTSLISVPGYTFYHNRPDYCPTAYSYRDSVGMCYKVHYDEQTHTSAASVCNGDGGHLIRVDTEAKQDYVMLMLKALSLQSTFHFYIEATDEQTEGVYKWADGRTVTYTSWYPSEPNNQNEVEHCIMLANSDYDWYDIPCSSPKRYICELSQ